VEPAASLRKSRRELSFFIMVGSSSTAAAMILPDLSPGAALRVAIARESAVRLQSTAAGDSRGFVPRKARLGVTWEAAVAALVVAAVLYALARNWFPDAALPAGASS
jgi:hypothetical protein